MTLQTGLVCYDRPKNGEDGQKCPNYEVRFCCEEEKDLSCLLHRPPFHPVRPNPEWLPPNDCCGERPYNTNLKVYAISDHIFLLPVALIIAFRLAVNLEISWLNPKLNAQRTATKRWKKILSRMKNM